MEQHEHHEHHLEKKLGFVENFALGGAAAVVSKTAAAPVERIKLLIQNQDEMIKAGRLTKPYKGVIDCTSRVYHTEGILPFWRGNLANCIRYLPTQALNFAFKDKINQLFKAKESDSYRAKFAKNITAGGCAGGLSLVFVYSLDYARTRLGNDTKAAGKGGERQFSGLIDVYRKTLQTDGFAGLYRGFVISCVGIVLYRGIYFGLYDSLKPIMLGEDAGFFALFTLGYAVTILGELVSYPVDTIRRRMMMTSGEPVKYKGSIDCFLQVVRKEGPMSLMKGALANVVRGVAGAGVLVGFDEFKKFYVAWRLA